MSELAVGTWNMLNSFGDERNLRALEVIKRMDADVLFLGETALLGAQNSDSYNEAEQAMREQLGYHTCLLSDYYPGPKDRPNQHLMSFWSRASGRTALGRLPFGNRYGIVYKLYDVDVQVVGFHPDDKNEDARTAAVGDLLDYLQTGTDKTIDPTVVMGDFNTAGSKMYLKAIDTVTKHLAIEHYRPDASLPHKLLSLAARTAAMGSGVALGKLEAAGFHDADERHRPTISFGPLKLQLDRIMGANVALENFQQHTDGSHLSDHTPITAVAKS